MRIPGFVIVLAETIKMNWFFEKQWWSGISEANLCRGSQNISSKICKIYGERPVS